MPLPAQLPLLRPLPASTYHRVRPLVTVDGAAPSDLNSVIATETTARIATQSEAESGTNNTQLMTPLRVAQATARSEQSIWSGSATSVSASDILANTGFTVVPGKYFINAFNLTYSIDIYDISRISTGSSSIDSLGNARVARADATGVFSVQDAGSGTGLMTLSEIFFMPF